MDLLKKKRVDCPSLYQSCLKEDETVKHVFAECEVAKSAWHYFSHYLLALSNLSFQSWVSTTFNYLNPEQISLFVSFCWWKARNDKVWENLTTGLIIAKRAKIFLDDWIAANQLVHRGVQFTNFFMYKWEKLIQG